MRWDKTGVIVAMLLLFGFGAASLRHLQGKDVNGPATAIDGDSLRIFDREIRLKGIDTPEYRQTCSAGDKQEIACGREARKALAELLARGNAKCRVSGQDRFNRDLAVCTVGDQDVNAAMVRAGMAVAFGDYESEEREARQARRGIWATTFERPSEWRAKHPRNDRP